METEEDLYNLETLSSEASDYHHSAERLAVEHSLPFGEAMELAVAEGEAIELIGENGAEKVILAPLAALTPLRQSCDCEALENARIGVTHFREKICEAASEKDPTKYSFSKIERITDFEDIGRFIKEWVDSNQIELKRLGIEDWHQLTPVQSALLSARIVDASLHYDYLAGGYRDSVPEEVRTLSDEQFAEAKEARAVQLDSYGMHQLLREGSGICQHYALATEFVFKTLKSLQRGDGLSGTEIFCIHSINNELDTSHHCYNLILVSDGDNLRAGIFDSLQVDGHPQDLNDWRQDIDKFHTRSAAAIFNLAMLMGVVDISSEEGEDKMRQWFEQNRHDSGRLFNALSFTLTLPSRFRHRDTDVYIDFIDEVKEEAEPNHRLVLELFKLRRAKYFRNYFHQDGNPKHLRPQVRKEIKPVNDAARNDIETILNEQLFNPELMAREVATRMLPLSDARALGEEMDEDNIRYDIEQGLGFVYYRTIITLSQAMLPFLPSGERQGMVPEMVKRSIEKSKIKFLKAQSVFADDLVHLADDGQLGPTYLQQLAEIVGVAEFVEVIEQGANSFGPILTIFQFSEEERETIQTNLGKSGEALAKIKARWPRLKKIIFASSSSQNKKRG